MQIKRIIGIETDDERIKQIQFLLRLAGYENLFAANISEAVNWARVFHQAGEDCLCLLINSVSSAEECLSYLQPLAQYTVQLPVIMVRRNRWDGDIPTARFPTLRILTCLPETINAALSAVALSAPLKVATARQVTA